MAKPRRGVQKVQKTARRVEPEDRIVTCSHCGMDDHVREDCAWAARSDRELAQEAARKSDKR